MSRGRRYETEGKLNYQKVFAVIIAIIVIAMVVMIIKNVFICGYSLVVECYASDLMAWVRFPLPAP